MASNRIKGITIEIGGDTTKLDKALKSTDSSLSTIQKNLKDVDRLLKLDPKNVELLDQKQRLLAQSSELTADRLKELKRVAEESTVSNVKYKQWQEAFTALQGQITKTSNELTKLEKEGEKLKNLGFAPDSAPMQEVQQKTEALRKKMADLQQETTDTFNALGKPISIEQWDALQREIAETENAAKEADKAFRSFNLTAERIGGAAGKVADGAKKIVDATKGISTAAGAAGAGLVGLAVKAGKTADDLNTLSKQSGFSTDDLQKWTYAADLVDVSVDDIIGSVRKMKKNMTSDSADVQAAFERVGVGLIQINDGTASLRDATDVFYDVLKGLSMIENETERDIVAMQLFGRSADDLAGIIDDGGAALRELGKEAENAGLILSQDALDGANEFNDGLDRLKAKAQAAFLEAGAELADTLLPALDDIVEALSGILQWFAQLDGGTLQLLLQVLLAVAAIAPVAGTISAIASAIKNVSSAVGIITGNFGKLMDVAGPAVKSIGGLSGIFDKIGLAAGGALKAVSSFLLGPAGIAIGAVAAAGGLIYLYETNEKFRGALESFDQWITGVFTTDWTESFGALGEVMNAFLRSAQEIYEGIKKTLGGIVDFVAGVFTLDWGRAWQGVIDIFGGLFDTLAAIIKAPINNVIGLINGMLQAVVAGVNAIIEKLNGISVEVPSWVPGLGGKSFGFDLQPVTAPKIPYLARGTVARPNNPFLAVIGDNPQEQEIVSPYSTIKQAVMDAQAEGGSMSRPILVNVNFTGSLAQLARVLQPHITAEGRRLGQSYAT